MRWFDAQGSQLSTATPPKRWLQPHASKGCPTDCRGRLADRPTPNQPLKGALRDYGH